MRDVSNTHYLFLRVIALVATSSKPITVNDLAKSLGQPADAVAQAVPLDLMQPVGPGGRLLDQGRKTWRVGTGGQPAGVQRPAHRGADRRAGLGNAGCYTMVRNATQLGTVTRGSKRNAVFKRRLRRPQ